ncbi:MAG: hypothetical protein JXA69_12415 [Phycisphaerae bacterium]|nr:hypothetical protein [Phycisphaerae bacterium]
MNGTATRGSVLAVLLLVWPNIVWSQNSAPVVGNVTASQLSGTGLVEIRYVLADADGDSCTIWVKVSDDWGGSWDVPAWSFTGDVGTGVRPGAGKRIVWDAGADWLGQAGQLKFRVYAEDSNGQEGMVFIPASEFLMGDTLDKYTQAKARCSYTPTEPLAVYLVTTRRRNAAISPPYSTRSPKCPLAIGIFLGTNLHTPKALVLCQQRPQQR